MAARVAGEDFNLGSGVETSIGDLALKACKLAGIECEIVTEEKRLRPAASEVDRLAADAQKALRLLQWEPQVDIDEGLSRTLAWLKKQQPEKWVREYQV